MNDDIDLDIIGYGTIIANNWRVDKKIGQGGFGIVY